MENGARKTTYFFFAEMSAKFEPILLFLAKLSMKSNLLLVWFVDDYGGFIGVLYGHVRKGKSVF